VIIDCTELMRAGEVGDEEATAASTALSIFHEIWGKSSFTARRVVKAMTIEPGWLSSMADDEKNRARAEAVVEALSELDGKRLDRPTAHRIGKLLQKRLVGRPTWIGDGRQVATLRKVTGHRENTYRIEVSNRVAGAGAGNVGKVGNVPAATSGADSNFPDVRPEAPSGGIINSHRACREGVSFRAGSRKKFRAAATEQNIPLFPHIPQPNLPVQNADTDIGMDGSTAPGASEPGWWWDDPAATAADITAPPVKNSNEEKGSSGKARRRATTRAGRQKPTDGGVPAPDVLSETIAPYAPGALDDEIRRLHADNPDEPISWLSKQTGQPQRVVKAALNAPPTGDGGAP